MRLGIIARYDNSGLSTLAREFVEHLNPTKILLVENGIFQTFPERFTDYETCHIEDGYEDFLKGLDIVLSFETFYQDSIITDARKLGIKTVLMTMCEMSPEKWGVKPDLFLCPSKLDLDLMPSPKVFLPVPVCTDHLQWRKRRRAKTFIHTASHGGANDRKGTFHLIQAMKYVKSNIRLIIYAWQGYHVDDPRIEIQVKNFKNYWQCWKEGDVLIYPQGANGICLPIVEAMASGMAVITTDLWPFNEYMPKDLLFKPAELFKTRMSGGLQEVEDVIIDPIEIAEKIDLVAGRNIERYSLYGRDWAMGNSWEMLLPRYQQMLENVCKTPK